MATQTQTIRRPALQPERVHDYLYDPHYNVSSERDHARATFKAHTSTDRVKRVPHYDTMFSELRHQPRFQMKLDTTDPVPKFISRQWRGYAEQAREQLVRYKTFNYDPSVKLPGQSVPEVQVSGPNRYKFFRRPIIPFLQQIPPDVQLASARQDPLTGGVGMERIGDRPPTPPYRTTMTQTDYRDSEAQTDPYTPEYVVRPGSQPELLTLATLSYGRGLPAGLAEVEMIERARTKRIWELTLPPLNDTSQLDKRRKMMDEMERKEWALRESEIEKLQEARLEVLKKLLRQREEHHQDLNTKRLDRLWAKKQEEKEHRVKKIRNEHIKAIRKLTKKRKNVEGKLERRDVVKDYSEHGSQTFAPLTRIGVFLDRGSEQFVVKSRYLNTYQGLLELEHSLPDFVVAPRVKAPKPKTSTKAGFVKRKYRQEKELEEIHEVIKENRTRVAEPPKPLRFLEKIEKPVPRPPTPSVEVPSEKEEEKELAVIFLQQLIRGRAIQNMMFEGKEKRKDLIQELRSTHALQDAEKQIKKQEKQATLALQRQRRLHEHKESMIDESLSQAEGSSLGDTLDFLSKELIRLQEERRIHAFSMLAERERRIREAEESGKRQVEERRRREEDEIFKQVIKVHQRTVDSYLEDVILQAVDKTADDQARQEIQDMARTINDLAYEVEERRTNLESEEIVSELVHGFLIPEVQKETLREKVHRQQRKYLNAAHQEIHDTGEGIIDMHPKARSNQQGATQQTQSNSSSSPESNESESQQSDVISSQRQQSPAGTPKDQRSGITTPQGRRSGAASPQEKKSGTTTPQGQRSGAASPQEKKSGTTTPQGQRSGAASPQEKKSGTTTPQGQRSGAASPQEKKSGTTTPQGQRSGAASPQEKKSGTTTPQGQRSGAASPQEKKSGTTTPQGQRSGAASPQEKKSGTTTPQGQRSGAASPQEKKSGTTTPQGQRSGAASPQEKKSGTTTPQGQRSGAASPQEKKSGTTTPQGQRSGVTSPQEQLRDTKPTQEITSQEPTNPPQDDNNTETTQNRKSSVSSAKETEVTE